MECGTKRGTGFRPILWDGTWDRWVKRGLAGCGSGGTPSTRSALPSEAPTKRTRLRATISSPVEAAHSPPTLASACASTGNLPGEAHESWPQRRSRGTCKPAQHGNGGRIPQTPRNTGRIGSHLMRASFPPWARPETAGSPGKRGARKPGPVRQIRKLREPRRGTAPAAARRERPRNGRSRRSMGTQRR